MAAPQKIVAVFVMCLIVLSAMHVEIAEAKSTSETYRKCFDKCQNECMTGGRGYTDCEMKCDTDCTNAEQKAKLAEFSA